MGKQRKLRAPLTAEAAKEIGSLSRDAVGHLFHFACVLFSPVDNQVALLVCIPLSATLFCFSLFSFYVWIGLCLCCCCCSCVRSAFIRICYLLCQATVFVDCRAISLSPPSQIVPALHSLAPSQQTTFTKRLF